MLTLQIGESLQKVILQGHPSFPQSIHLAVAEVMGKTKRLRLATKLRHAPLNEQLIDSSGVKKRVKKKREDKPTENDEQV